VTPFVSYEIQNDEGHE